MQFKRFVPLLGFVAFGLLLWWGLNSNRDIREIPSPLVGKPVPAFQLPLLDKPGQQLGNAEFAGQVVLLNFWGSWCAVCVQEHPYLQQLADQGVSIVGINYRDDTEDAREWLQKYGNPYSRVLVDREGDFAIDLVYTAPRRPSWWTGRAPCATNGSAWSPMKSGRVRLSLSTVNYFPSKSFRLCGIPKYKYHCGAPFSLGWCVCVGGLCINCELQRLHTFPCLTIEKPETMLSCFIMKLSVVYGTFMGIVVNSIRSLRVKSSPPPIQWLSYFEATARHLSVNAAAKELNITPSAVSQKIKNLEHYLGLDVFHREKQRLFLTDTGKEYYLVASEVLSTYSEGYSRLYDSVVNK